MRGIFKVTYNYKHLSPKQKGLKGNIYLVICIPSIGLVLFLMVLLVYMASVRGHSWTQMLAWFGAGHLKWLHLLVQSVNFVWVATASRGWLGPSLSSWFAWVYFYGGGNAKWSNGKKGSCLNFWVPDCCFGTFIPSKHLTIKESRK